MVLTKNPFPAPGELVVCLVTNIQSGYVQVKLEDYKGTGPEGVLNGMVHISELSNRWVKNIHSIISVGSKVVLLVLRVNEERGYVDLSLRRVNQEQKSNKMNDWRYANKAENLMKYLAEQYKVTLEDLYKQALFPLIDKYGDIRTAFEDIKEEGIEILNKTENITLSPELKQTLFKIIDENVEIHKVTITAEYEIRSGLGNGIELIKEALVSAKKLRRPKGIDIRIFYIGAPVYRCEIIASDYPSAEKFLEKVTKKIEATLEKNGTVEVHRDNLSNEQKSAST
jgi:translation initiation factor 2 subunit 1